MHVSWPIHWKVWISQQPFLPRMSYCHIYQIQSYFKYFYRNFIYEKKFIRLLKSVKCYDLNDDLGCRLIFPRWLPLHRHLANNNLDNYYAGLKIANTMVIYKCLIPDKQENERKPWQIIQNIALRNSSLITLFTFGLLSSSLLLL